MRAARGKLGLGLGLGLGLSGCAHGPTHLRLLRTSGRPTIQARFDRLPAEAAIDPSAGVSLISRALCAQLGCRTSGVFEGRRATGEVVRVPVTTLRAVRLGARRLPELVAGVVDLAPLEIEPGIEAVLSLSAFRGAAITIDRRRGVVLRETEASLARRVSEGQVIAARVLVDGPATTVELEPAVRARADAADLVTYDLPGGRVILGQAGPSAP